VQDIKSYIKYSGDDFPFPIICDESRRLGVELGMLDPDEKDSSGMPVTCRAVFIVAPDKKLKLSILYPATTGRNFEYAPLLLSISIFNNHNLQLPLGEGDL
jgi:1-Cys peroxiredoxin 6